MKLSDFDFDLPDNLIAQSAMEPRDHSKLMVLEKNKQVIEHKKFYNISDYLKKGDVLVVNRTRVIPARLFGKKDTGSILECFLLKRIDLNTWEVLLKPAKKLKIGQKIVFLEGKLEAVLKEVKDDGNRILEFIYEGNFEEILDELGEMPLPPYITEKLKDKNRYQTVYAKEGESVAAPTAGLHFTNELLEKLKDSGVELTEIYLVGLGTFRPVQTENILEHKMHHEKYHIPEESAEIINRAKREGRRIIAVGTTTVRTLESSNNGAEVISGDGETDIFIYGDYKFKIVDALITNFHLPKSTLLMLISAFAGKNFIFTAYETAIQEKYRFYSFGDAMFIY